MSYAAALSRGSSVAPAHIPGDACNDTARADSACNAYTDTACIAAPRAWPFSP